MQFATSTVSLLPLTGLMQVKNIGTMTFTGVSQKLMTSAISISRIFRIKFDNFSNCLGTFRNNFQFISFVQFFSSTACAAAIFFIRKASKSEPSSRFFGRLKIFDFRDMHYLLHALTQRTAINLGIRQFIVLQYVFHLLCPKLKRNSNDLFSI